MKPMHLSIIIPVFNEQENIPLLIKTLSSFLSSLRFSTEILLVDDGSMDDSFTILKKLVHGKHHFCLLRLRRNFGQTAAIAAGIEYATGKIIVLMDADLQNDPADIPKLLKKLDEGYDIVSGWRRKRKDNFISRTIPSKMANRLISYITGVHLHDYGCTLKAYRREVIKDISLYGEMHRFLPALCVWNGARVTEIEVLHHPRLKGKSKYGIMRTFKVVLDLFTVKFLGSFISKPIYLFGGAGIISILAGFLVVGFMIHQKITVPKFYFIQSPLLLLSAMLEILGTMLVMMGVLAELLVRIYFESQGKKPYVLREVVSSTTHA